MSDRGRLDFPSGRADRWWRGLPQTTMTRSEADGATLAAVSVEFRKALDQEPFLTWTSDGGDVEILDAAAWQFRIPGRNLDDWEPGTYLHEIVTTDSLGRVLGYLNGRFKVEGYVLSPETAA